VTETSLWPNDTIEVSMKLREHFAAVGMAEQWSAVAGQLANLSYELKPRGSMLPASKAPMAEDAANALALALRQARYALRDFNVKQPGCGFSKLADACGNAADTIVESYRGSEKPFEAMFHQAWVLNEVLGEVIAARVVSHPRIKFAVSDTSAETFDVMDTIDPDYADSFDRPVVTDCCAVFDLVGGLVAEMKPILDDYLNENSPRNGANLRQWLWDNKAGVYAALSRSVRKGDLRSLQAFALDAAQEYCDAADNEATNWTGYGDQTIPPHAAMRLVKAGQAVAALRDADMTLRLRSEGEGPK
jgi:hypothetical protein